VLAEAIFEVGEHFRVPFAWCVATTTTLGATVLPAIE